MHQNYHISASTTLEDCLMALDLETPTMDRGSLRIDNISIWEWRDGLLLDCRSVCSKVDPIEFAIALGCLLLQWMCGLCLPQDSLLCCLPLCRPELSGRLLPIVRGLWFIINQACQQISTAGFHKDERSVGRNFFSVKLVQEEPVASGVSWLDHLQAFFWTKKWRDGGLIPVLPSIDISIESFKGLLEPLLSNTFGVGCTRNSRPNLSIDFANNLINNFNAQIRSFHDLNSCLASSMSFHSLADVANQIDLKLNSNYQIVRAISINELFSNGLLASSSLLWATTCGAPMALQEYRAACDAVHCLLHSAPRLHRLIPDWLEGVKLIREPFSASFHALIIFMKMKFVQLGFELKLYSLNESEHEEAEQWIQKLSTIQHGLDSVHIPANKASKRFKHRWRCLL